MQQSSSGVLISIILIVGLAVAFAVGIHYVGAGLASSSVAAPTATVVATEVVGPPTDGGTGQQASNPGTGQTSGPPATATPSPPPPTATPAPQVDVVMSTALGRGETAAQPTTAFSTSAPQVYCVATFRKVGPSDGLAFRYVSADTNAMIWTSGPSDILPPIVAEEHGTSRATYLSGPLSAGKYRCDVLFNGKSVASVPFTVQ